MLRRHLAKDPDAGYSCEGATRPSHNSPSQGSAQKCGVKSSYLRKSHFFSHSNDNWTVLVNSKFNSSYFSVIPEYIVLQQEDSAVEYKYNWLLYGSFMLMN